jgi:hypothetical protein
MTLTTFLLARLDEDEAVARPLAPTDELVRESELDETLLRHVARFGRERVLKEVEMKRQIIALAYEATGLDMDRDLDRAVGAREASGVEFVGDRMLRALATPYMDHPDYDDAWRL